MTNVESEVPFNAPTETATAVPLVKSGAKPRMALLYSWTVEHVRGLPGRRACRARDGRISVLEHQRARGVTAVKYTVPQPPARRGSRSCPRAASHAHVRQREARRTTRRTRSPRSTPPRARRRRPPHCWLRGAAAALIEPPDPRRSRASPHAAARPGAVVVRVAAVHRDPPSNKRVRRHTERRAASLVASRAHRVGSKVEPYGVPYVPPSYQPAPPCGPPRCRCRAAPPV